MSDQWPPEQVAAAYAKKKDVNSLELRIGMLRQWLNEDRITDPSRMVTNEDIHHWLDVGIKTHTAEQVQQGRLDEVEQLQYVDWESASPVGSGINELFDPCIETYIHDRINQITKGELCK